MSEADTEWRKIWGVGVICERPDGKVLMGLRRGSHGAGVWALPGGKVDGGESLAECCARELREETGIEVSPEEIARLAHYEPEIFEEDRVHSVSLYHYIRLPEGTEPEICEPDKCERWGWFDWDLAALPENVFPSLPAVVRALPDLSNLPVLPRA